MPRKLPDDVAACNLVRRHRIGKKSIKNRLELLERSRKLSRDMNKKNKVRCLYTPIDNIDGASIAQTVRAVFNPSSGSLCVYNNIDFYYQKRSRRIFT